MALSLSDVTEQPHFDLLSFRTDKRIFATLDIKKNRACLMLSLVDQSVFTVYDKQIIYAVPNKWGKKGATFFELNEVPKNMLKHALTLAYNKALV